MKANELMVGDWVQNTFMGNKVLCKVVGISTDITIEYQNRTRKYEALKEVEPIPLTAEILEKNGFDCSDGEVVRYNFTDGDYQGHFSLRGMYSGNTPKGWSFFAFNVLTIIDYVHELQHALRLCRIEKEIQL